MKEATLQTLHVDSMLKRRENGRFHVVSTWNPRGVFVGRYDLETSPLTCFTSQWTGFYMITASVMKELNCYTVSQLVFSVNFLKVSFSELKSLLSRLKNRNNLI